MECAKKGFFFQDQIDFPTLERMKKRAVAIIECCQEIPCNPCVDACPVGAISIEHNINAPPVIDFERCTGCGLCLGFCPGLAIFLVDLSKGKARVTIPYELFPPKKGETVGLLNRSGDVIGQGTVERVNRLKKHDRTLTVTLIVDDKLIREVRGFRSKK